MESSDDETDETGFECTICDDKFDSEDELRDHRKEEHPSRTCSQCGSSLDHSPFRCNYCDETFCSSHRLPEKHECPGLSGDEKESKDDSIMYMSSKKETNRKTSSKSSSKASKRKTVTRSSDSGLNTPDISGAAKKFYSRRVKGGKKFIPIIGVLLLLFISSYQSPNALLENGDLNDKELDETLSMGLQSLQDSIIFEGKFHLLMTFALVFTIWSVYAYWLKDLKYIRRNSGSLEKLVTVVIMLILVDRHVKINSALGVYADWGLFLAVLYLELAGTWFLAKTIDGIDLSSDLYNWGLRLLGSITILFGALLFVSSGLALTLSNSQLVFSNVYWIGSVCLILLGAFMEYRSFRRHPAIHVW